MVMQQKGLGCIVLSWRGFSARTSHLCFPRASSVFGKVEGCLLSSEAPTGCLAEPPGPRPGLGGWQWARKLQCGFLGEAARFSSNVYFAKDKRSIGFRSGGTLENSSFYNFTDEETGMGRCDFPKITQSSACFLQAMANL